MKKQNSKGMNTMQLAFKKSGIKTKKTFVRWPSIRNRPQTITITIDEKLGAVTNIHFLVKESK